MTPIPDDTRQLANAAGSYAMEARRAAQSNPDPVNAEVEQQMLALRDALSQGEKVVVPRALVESLVSTIQRCGQLVDAKHTPNYTVREALLTAHITRDALAAASAAGFPAS